MTTIEKKFTTASRGAGRLLGNLGLAQRFSRHIDWLRVQQALRRSPDYRVAAWNTPDLSRYLGISRSWRVKSFRPSFGPTTCQTPGWWGCLDETTTSSPVTSTITTTTTTSTCKTLDGLAITTNKKLLG